MMKILLRVCCLSVLLVTVSVMFSVRARAQSQVVLYDFKGGADGYEPTAPMISDRAGNLYGVTFGKYDYTWGTVFELTKKQDGTWSKTQLYTFTGKADGSEPAGRLFLDEDGNLFGTTSGGGAYHAGTIFELMRQPGGTWKETVIHDFGGTQDGSSPEGGLVRDAQGNFFGATSLGGGKLNGGTVFELSPDGLGGWSEKVIFSFSEAGGGPYDGLVMDVSGNLFGTTFRGGDADGGTVFELSPQGDGSWQERIIHSFGGLFQFGDGSEPVAALVQGRNGQLFGTTETGGSNTCYSFPFGCGTVFELAPGSNGTWRERVIHDFSGDDGFLPLSQLAIDGSGNLYGTTQYGGDAGGCFYDNVQVNCGTAFKLGRTGGGAWTEQALVNFDDALRGGQPGSGLVLDQIGNLYGTSDKGGKYNAGLVYEIQP